RCRAPRCPDGPSRRGRAPPRNASPRRDRSRRSSKGSCSYRERVAPVRGEEDARRVELLAETQELLRHRQVAAQVTRAELGVARQVLAPVESIAEGSEKLPELPKEAGRRVVMVALEP